jgi:hypothetical protein
MPVSLSNQKIEEPNQRDNTAVYQAKRIDLLW